MNATPTASPDPTALWNALAPEQRDLLRLAADATRNEGGDTYLVGGPVRDLVRGDIQLHDIDLVTTVDARRVAARLAEEAKPSFARMTDFGTATVHVFDDGETRVVDIATARTEMYPRPGALPQVTMPASIHEDLRRRDFTINAMALPITDTGFGPLLDPYDGLTDLRAGRIRVLHDASFRDDPTRLYRVARYAARFGFALEAETTVLFRDALTNGALTTISADRKRHELERGQRERDNVAAFAAFDAFGLLRATSPVLIWDDWVARRIRLVTPDAWPIWAFFASRQGFAALERLFTDLAYPGKQDSIRILVHVWQERDAIANAERLSSLVPLLGRLPPRQVLALLVDEPARAKAVAFFERLEAMRAQSKQWNYSFGNQLQEIGVPAGPAYQQALIALRDARLDGEVNTLEDARDFVRRYVEEHGLKP